MNKNKVQFLNTCAFDTITEILSSACCDIENFRTFIMKNRDESKAKKYLCYASAIMEYSISGVNNLLYPNRAH